MPRVQMIDERSQAAPEQLEAFDRIVASRGRMLRPFAALLHRPEIATAIAELGAIIRFDSTIGAGNRELVILTTAVERGCDFERDAHLGLAREAGVGEETLSAVLDNRPVEDRAHRTLVEFARELCRTNEVSESTFSEAMDLLGEPGTVELAAIVGYYSMMTLILNACEAC